MKAILVLAYLVVSFLQFNSFAFDTDDMSLHPFLINHYELQSQTWSVSQDPNNHLVYMANSRGLIEYNGISWRRYPLREDIPLRSVGVHPDGKIFTGSFEEFGYWERNQNLELEYHTLTHLTEVPNNDEIWRIYTDSGSVYFQSFTSVYVYDFNSVKRITAPWTLFSLHRVEGEYIAQVLRHGLFRFVDEQFVLIEKSEMFGEMRVHAILPLGGDRMLICTHKEGLYVYDGNDFSYFDAEASDFLKTHTCNNARELGGNKYVFGSILNGIIVTDENGNIQQSFNTHNGLNNNTVLALCLDNDEGLWVGLDEGVNYIELSSPRIHYKSRNVAFGTIYALLKHNNSLYIGTNHGLYKAEIIRRARFFYFTNLKFINGSQGQVWALIQSGDQILCGHNEGTFLVKNDQLERISEVTGSWNFQPFGDYLISGTYTGIIFLGKDQAGKWRFRNKISGFNEPTRYLETDYLGYIWASHHQRGIFQIELSDNMQSMNKVRNFQEINNRSFNIRVFKVNNRVVFTTTENIYTFDFVRNEIIQFSKLADDLEEYRSSYQIQHYKKNQYWFIMEDKIGLFEITIDFSAQKLFEIPHLNSPLPQRSIQLLSLDDRTVIIPSAQSFDAYNLDLVQISTKFSRLRKEKILLFGRNDSIVVTSNLDQVRIPFNTNNFTIFFSDPSNFSLTNRVYQYRIIETDPKWQNTTNDYFTFRNLKHGKYTLEIRSGPDTTISARLLIMKPWYQTHLAIVTYSALLLLIIWGIYHFFRFEISRHKELISFELRQNSLLSELDYKSHELMLSMRQLITKNEIFSDLQKQIDAIREQSSKYPIRHINNLERIIKKGLGTTNAEWESAIQNLKLSQQGFFRYLKERYPDLTPHDLRLCSFLRLNFNTKEIAQLLNISTRTVETSRHRLRKKLKLGKKDNLVEFLIGLHWEDDQTE